MNEPATESAGATPAPADLVGVWRLVSFHDLGPAGERREGPLGPAPRGLLIYTADGHVSVSMSRAPDAPRDGTRFMGYAGTWQLTGHQVVHTVAVTPRAGWADTRQVRDLQLAGDRLTLHGTDTGPPVPQRRVLTWQRVRPVQAAASVSFTDRSRHHERLSADD
ncbi:lipocalin-like domain-containing protein [Streptomyces misionensis]|uniref:Lipocalin-like domain-containing protein n=1 Tax=Streptomyces misionensis TaxID=67331 RepID=A0A5C6K2W2_9ACTN|nr:lipocalin-like domain-containing protein [Streptomyces misionensis]TWV57410.1 lipocalin-like domain-containing protein [Streptomyces misionensis]